ncbi:MAG: 16S rRNA (guanine(527)-N(7))-methyltransferase RsmG [Anaerovibrio sp.]|uniref:16S rRNA (guanine(527)-N(7))-methyltransferase RsmG n=1 Tax=Anaerovibrio sp. TaxID=1872532 RepID=UPI0025FC676B|nr:16S rRNA (guanine(527)-N(7))-methyltransferase RsmG [Anaerovibrio sp.]MCR5176082.1 16S rRNA (guanine(527)-N(7))-methyltransferase RsmG [Anaerovibrio sp.]
MSFEEYLRDAAGKYGVTFTEHQVHQFDQYYRLLVEWNEKINLTAITEPREVAIKHMIDSVSCWDEKRFKNVQTVIDVGTGAGFPGIPLKIFIPDIKLTLLDSLNKRINFLQTVVDTLQLSSVECIHSRAEEGARNKILRDKFDLAVSRAVARLPVLAEYCLPFVKKNGYFAALKGMKFAEETQEAEKAISILGGKIEDCVEIKLPYLEDRRAVIYIKKEKNTPKAYPRKAGTPDKKPL